MDFVRVYDSGDKKQAIAWLDEFAMQNATAFTFPKLDSCELQKETWAALASLLNNPLFADSHLKCLQVMKILSRDKRHLSKTIDAKIMATLMTHANLNISNKLEDACSKYDGISEAQKCIFNLILNEATCRKLIIDAEVTEGLILQLIQETPHQIRIFNLKILFLLTALCSECRPRLRYTLRGLHYLCDSLDVIALAGSARPLNEEEIDSCCEMLKVLYNLLLSDKKPEPNEVAARHPEVFAYNQEEESQEFVKLTETVRRLLAVDAPTKEKQHELKSHVVNLLTNIDANYLKNWATINEQAVGSKSDFVSSPIDILLQFLDSRLGHATQVLQEKLGPILTVLIEFCDRSSSARKLIRQRVLPPLRDVSHRPEQGNELRNKLCRLMTSSVTQVQMLVAEFLFILCKHNVNRLIKYTGYGNAAGLLANRGLLAGNRSRVCYSDSEDSETEEYRQVEDKVNPVTGCVEAPRQNPMDGMTDEQKEYETVRLLNIMDKLQREGVIQPARIGQDGKPHAIEHVLQLTEQMVSKDCKDELGD